MERSLGIDVIDEQTAAHLRRMSGVERLRLAGALREDTRRRLALHLRAQHPDWTPRQVSEELARRAALGRDNLQPH